MKTWLKVTFAIFGSLVLIAGGLAYYLTRPVAGVAYSDPVSRSTRHTHSILLTSLASHGITKAMADVSDKQVYLSFSAPPGLDPANAVAKDQLQAYVLGAASKAGTSGTAVIVQYEGDKPVLMWKADLAGLQDVLAGKADAGAYFASIEKKAL